MKDTIKIGATFSDYELPDQTGTRRKLSELQGSDPMVLVLSRGHYCPKDRQQHRLLVEMEAEFRVAYTRIVTISTDHLAELNEMREGVNAHWPFLADPERTIQKDLDIQEYTDQRHNPMVPHTFVLKPGLTIHSIYNGYWFWGRPSQEDLRHDLRQVSQEIRPDWDLGRPELRESWEKRDRSSFWPYKS
ncbi:MAG TPA: redoxin domain-containing protein [Candidatus Acidoferrales bacterium]|nr:redoxin domain-containing protein [Candidatus Acidoferrales bacterium]